MTPLFPTLEVIALVNLALWTGYTIGIWWERYRAKRYAFAAWVNLREIFYHEIPLPSRFSISRYPWLAKMLGRYEAPQTLKRNKRLGEVYKHPSKKNTTRKPKDRYAPGKHPARKLKRKTTHPQQPPKPTTKKKGK